MPTAIITGASRGLGLALSRTLAGGGWRLVIDARNTADLDAAARELGAISEVVALAGDITDPHHRHELVAAAGDHVDLLVNNAGTLGPSPLPSLADVEPNALARTLNTNVVSQLALAQLALPLMAPGAVLISISSDAAVEPYEGWGTYGASKAALDQLTAVLAAENPQLHIYSVDPGDMRTQMHQDAFPGEDISDRPLPAESVPGILRLLDGELPSGRYRAHELHAPVAG